MFLCLLLSRATQHKPYTRTNTHTQTLEAHKRGAGTFFDPITDSKTHKAFIMYKDIQQNTDNKKRIRTWRSTFVLFFRQDISPQHSTTHNQTHTPALFPPITHKHIILAELPDIYLIYQPQGRTRRQDLPNRQIDSTETTHGQERTDTQIG